MSLTKVKAGNILLTTPAASSNDVTPATTQYVTTALANMVDSAPSTLNTLNELAAALGDDANFSTTVTNSIAGKLPLAGGTLTGDITNSQSIFNITNNDIRFKTSGAETMLRAVGNGAVELMHNNVTRVATSADGATITSLLTLGQGSTNHTNNSIHANSNNYMYLYGGTSGLYLADNQDIGNAIGIRNDNYIDFTTNGTERMRIDSSGNIGVGITSGIDGKFHILQGSAGSVTASTDKNSLVVENSTHGGISMLVPDAAEAGIFTGHPSAARCGEFHTRFDTRMLRIGTRGHADFETQFYTGNWSEAMRIDKSGYVGIGTDSPAFLGLTGSGTSRVLQVHGTNTQLRLTNSIIHHDNAGLTKLTIRNNYGATSNSAQMELQAGFITLETGTSFTERFRINSSGRQTYNSSGTANGHATFVGEVGVSFKALAFERTVGGGEVGTIVTNANGTVTYGGTSDYRLKENVDYTWDATSRLKQLKPARFNFIADDTNTLIDGFLAHEVSSIVPEAIVGEKDGMADPILYENGDEIPEGKNAGDVKTPSVPEYQMMDNSKLVPLLVKTIQELEARITTLEG